MPNVDNHRAELAWESSLHSLLLYPAGTDHNQLCNKKFATTKPLQALCNKATASNSHGRPWASSPSYPAHIQNQLMQSGY